MANRDAPRGLIPLSHLTGGVIRASEYTITSGYGTLIATGDPVVTNASVGSRQTIERAAVDSVPVGVFGGCYYVDSTGEPRFEKVWRAGTTVLANTVVRAIVYDDPDQKFVMQGDTVLPATSVGRYCQFLVATGSEVTGRSAFEIDISLASATKGTLPLKIMSFVEAPDNDPTLINADYVVMFAQHELRAVMP